MQRAPPPTGEPGKAPASYIRWASAAVMRPSFVAPIFTLRSALEVGPLATNTSVLFICIFTGLPVFLESRAATGSRYMPPTPFPPKPPPISIATVFTWDVGMSSTADALSRTPNNCWVLVQMVK